MFPFSIRGSIKIETKQTYSPELEQTLLNRFIARLKKEKAKRLDVDQNSLHFTTGFQNIFNFSRLLELIERGSISIEPEGQGFRVEYELWYVVFIVLVTIMLLVIRILTPRQGWYLESPLESVFIWLAVGAGNILISVIRFRIMLRAEISKV